MCINLCSEAVRDVFDTVDDMLMGGYDNLLAEMSKFHWYCQPEAETVTISLEDDHAGMWAHLLSACRSDPKTLHAQGGACTCCKPRVPVTYCAYLRTKEAYRQASTGLVVAERMRDAGKFEQALEFSKKAADTASAVPHQRGSQLKDFFPVEKSKGRDMGASDGTIAARAKILHAECLIGLQRTDDALTAFEAVAGEKVLDAKKWSHQMVVHPVDARAIRGLCRAQVRGPTGRR
jgi:hypothetical protein